ncbi:uncharacterized protein LOC122319718 isoform X1 [Drosophila ficusphila]|uniref:uncharacterized protein LOC122319718 isoform X1 n=1 Tax=Drosophila ficusphila TaxID=30025 RepID=UPI001C89308F|nr:uncharacterized protein LOC122319718 isoform X1 [Drosophila ficusphila]XP_043063253.1 uncharacterized protein LOC122319718 isoform X1 [Drosophila ficusphila]
MPGRRPTPFPSPSPRLTALAGRPNLAVDSQVSFGFKYLLLTRVTTHRLPSRDSGWLQGTHAARRTHSVYVAGPPSDGRPLLPRYPAAPRPVAYHRLAVSALPQPACLSADRPPPPVFAGPDAAAAGLLLFIYFFM